jgi:RNA polymerase sigma-70 factor (ECF subfamily)
MSPSRDDTSQILLQQAAAGDQRAANQLLELHRQRLRAMIAMRLDRRLSARVDPSDVLQDTLAEAHQKLPEYLRTQRIPFYPWLRRLAWEKIV